MSHGLHVVRYAGATRETHKLAFFMPRFDSVRVVFSDDEIVCDSHELHTAVKVELKSLQSKAFVQATVERDYAALRAVLAFEEQHLMDKLEADLAMVNATMPLMELPRDKFPNAQKIVPESKHYAADAINEFKDACAEGDERLDRMKENIDSFRFNSEPLMPTFWIKKPPKVKGMTLIDLKKRATMREVKKLCKDVELLPPKGFIKSHSHHYGKYDSGKLVTVLSLCAVNLNNIPGSMAISVDIAASCDTHHSMSIAIQSLKTMLGKRGNSVLFAQVAQTDSARNFWAGKLTNTKRASVMTALFSEFDRRYPIYEECDDMADFF